MEVYWISSLDSYAIENTIILFPEGQKILVDIRLMILKSVLSSITEMLAIFSLVFMNDFTSIWTPGLLCKTTTNKFLQT